MTAKPVAILLIHVLPLIDLFATGFCANKIDNVVIFYFTLVLKKCDLETCFSTAEKKVVENKTETEGKKTEQISNI